MRAALNKDSVMSEAAGSADVLVMKDECSPRGVLGKQFKVHTEQEGTALECQAKKAWALFCRQ